MAPEHEPVVRRDLLPVDADRDAAERLQLYAGRGDDDVGVEMPARAQRDSGGIHVIDVVGDHLHVPGADGVIEVGAENEAQPLIPGVVRRLEVGVDVVALGQVRFRDAAEPALAELRRLACDEPQDAAKKRVAPPDDPVSNPQRQHLPDRVGRRFHLHCGDHVRRRALQHRHVGSILCQRRDHADGGRTAADDNESLTGVVECHSGQCCGCTTSPVKFSIPGNVGA